ncbi:MAG: hypothetical protein LBQ92_05015, partial [Propionibacteriaceae bacterium]|nr:hypothetical protein [Propionibacteriaceae bacterium]
MNAKRIAAAWMGLALVLGLAPMGQLPAQAANNPIHFSRQPAQRSVYAKGAPMRLSVQAESTEGKALSYQWKWSESADLSNAHTVTGVGGSGQQAVLTATTPTAIGSHYYWVEVTADGATVCSDTAEVVVLDEIVADTYTVGHTKADGSTYTQSDYDGYYLKYNQLFTKLLNGNMQDDAFTAYDGYTAGGGSTRANRSTTLNVSISAGAHFAFWDTTHIARSLSGGATNKEIQRVINSGSQNLAWDFAAEDGAYVQPTWDGTHLAGVANKGQHEFNGGVELSGDWPSSIYQEIATVPGKVYEWSLDHGQFALTGKHELMAVVIGPAAESDDTFFPYGKVSAALGSAGGGQQTLFYQVVDQVLEEQSLGKPTLDSLGSFQSQAYSTTYDGSHYYVYLARTGGTRFGGVRHSGAYSVPRGQGRTVFGFVDIVTHSSTDGNLLDNIVFKSGSAPSQEQAVAYSGESSIHADTVAGYAYALAEVRGSAVYPLQERDAWFTPSGGSAQTASVNAGLGDGVSWYTPGKGTLTFKNLVPGKTYRLIGIPSATVSTALGTNVAPAGVALTLDVAAGLAVTATNDFVFQRDGGAYRAFMKTGAGLLTLSGSSDFGNAATQGLLLVNGGTLAITGAIQGYAASI